MWSSDPDGPFWIIIPCFTGDYKEGENCLSQFLHTCYWHKQTSLTWCHCTHLLDPTTSNNTVWWLDCYYPSFPYIIIPIKPLMFIICVIKLCVLCKAGWLCTVTGWGSASQTLWTSQALPSDSHPMVVSVWCYLLLRLDKQTFWPKRKWNNTWVHIHKIFF